MTDKPHRGTIFVEEAEVLAHDAFPGEQYVLRLAAPECAAAARPGSFVHLRCDPMLPMRRPLSLLRADARAGWIECLYKAVGDGTRLLTQRKVGEQISVMGPIGKPFAPDPDRGRPLLIGGGVGMPPMIFLASALRAIAAAQPFVILGSEVPFPFAPRPSQLMIQGLPAGVIAAMPLLDDWGVPSRLASLQGFPGCHDGYVTDLARHWLDGLDDDARAQVEVFSCGPHAMLAAVASLARDYDLPCQVSLEEYMACGVGGCAGCVVEVQSSEGPTMKRVCVDGPVFDARQVFP
jgi:dihydroorotate dehydrogenase electron transfer subunit